MLDHDIQRLLDTVFNVPVGAEAPDVAQLRATAEAVPGRFGGDAGRRSPFNCDPAGHPERSCPRSCSSEPMAVR